MSFAELRKEHGFTQQSIADQLNVTQSTVAMWETGRSVPSFKTLVLLSELLSVSVDELCKALTRE